MEGKASGGRGSSEVLATIDVPAGETWLVAAIGQMTTGSTVPANRPELRLGDEVSVLVTTGTRGLATTATETVNFTIERNGSGGSDTFTGHVYTVKL